MPEPYFVTSPVKDEPNKRGYAYWDVRERESSHGPNFSLVSIFKDAPDAQEWAERICKELNRRAQVED